MKKLIILLLFISSGLYSQSKMLTPNGDTITMYQPLKQEEYDELGWKEIFIESDSVLQWTGFITVSVDTVSTYVQVHDTIEGVLVFINDWENPELIVSKAYCVRNRYVLSDAFYYSIDNDYFFIRNKEYEFIDNDVVVTEGDIIIHIENSRIVNWLPKL